MESRRKLLPYEYQLIEALDISKEEYLDFVAAQQIHNDIKDGTIFDIRNEPVSITLAIVGILFQVASYFLAPRPEIPDSQGVGRTRDQRVAPRFGFNGVQELAKYGESVPLIYTSIQDHAGAGIRVSTSLLWSAVLSFGGSQFMQLMLSVGAGRIVRIDPRKTAIGQLPLSDYIQSNIWLYFNSQGPTNFGQLINGNGGRDPVAIGGSAVSTARISAFPGSQNGFSQAYSPSSNNASTVTGVVPIRCDVVALAPNGRRRRKKVNNQFNSLNGQNYWQDDGGRPFIPVGTSFRLLLPGTESSVSEDAYASQSRQDALRAQYAILSEGGRFKIGSAIFRLTRVSIEGDGGTIDDGDVKADFVCERGGILPSRIRYNKGHWLDYISDEPDESFNVLGKDESTGNSNLVRERIASLRERINSYRRDVDLLEDFIANTDTARPKSPSYSPRIDKVTDKYNRKKFRDLGLVIGDEFNRGDARRIINDYILPRISSLQARLAENRAALTELQSYKYLYTKCLARFEEAAYATVTRCNVIDFAIKAKVFKRISGRADVYGSDQEDLGDSSGDNGPKSRTAMFFFYWREIGQTEYYRCPWIFCLRGNTEQEFYTFIRLQSSSLTPAYWEFKIEPVLEPYTEAATPGTSALRGYCYLQNSGNQATRATGDGRLDLAVRGVFRSWSDLPPRNKAPDNTNEWDLFNYDVNSQSQFSFEQGPELTIATVNEQLVEPWSNYGASLYSRLSTIALHAFAAKNTQDLRNVTIWTEEAKAVRRIDDTNPYQYESSSAIDSLINQQPFNRSSSFACDIFLDTVLDKVHGIGQYASIHSIDVVQLALSKRFCRANGLFMDGLVAEQRPWRQFWAETAGSSLLEFARIGGRDTLVPAVPYDTNTGKISRQIIISALFNQTNILEDSYREEFIDYGASSQDLIANVVYRENQTGSIFPKNATVTVQRSDANELNAIKTTLDVSQFVTTKKQAILIGKLACQNARYNNKAIEFRTFPTDSPIFPGAFIYVEIGQNEWRNIYSGRIEANGELNSPITKQIPDGTYNVLVYRAGSPVQSLPSVSIANNSSSALAIYENCLFVLGNEIKDKKVYKITEVEMDEEGETTIRAIFHATDSQGLSLLTQGMDAVVPNLFLIDGAAE